MACAAAAAVLVFGLAGHTVPQEDAHQGMVGSAVGLCMLLLATLALVCAEPSEPVASTLGVARDGRLAVAQMPRAARTAARARASPAVLQRFRN